MFQEDYGFTPIIVLVTYVDSSSQHRTGIPQGYIWCIRRAELPMIMRAISPTLRSSVRTTPAAQALGVPLKEYTESRIFRGWGYRRRTWLSARRWYHVLWFTLGALPVYVPGGPGVTPRSTKASTPCITAFFGFVPGCSLRNYLPYWCPLSTIVGPPKPDPGRPEIGPTSPDIA